jgi:hypothetical protein
LLLSGCDDAASRGERARSSRPASSSDRATGPVSARGDDTWSAKLPVLERAIDAHGGAVLRHARVELDFRGDHFIIQRNGGEYRYERIREENGHTVRDVRSNEGFVRYVDGEPKALSAERAAALSRSVNSVVYFALVPFFLADPAVRPERLPDVSLGGTRYARVRVRFAAEGGGADHDDVFLYWFRRPGLELSYLAYKFHSGDGGVRFREAVNPRTVRGVRFADYENYALPEDDPQADRPMEVSLAELLKRHRAGELRHVSTVALRNIEVEPLGEPLGEPLAEPLGEPL